MTTTPTRVLCVDDHAFVVEGLRSRLALESDLEWAGRLASAEHLVPEVQRTRPNIVLLDIEMPGPDAFGAMEDLNVGTGFAAKYVTPIHRWQTELMLCIFCILQDAGFLLMDGERTTAGLTCFEPTEVSLQVEFMINTTRMSIPISACSPVPVHISEALTLAAETGRTVWPQRDAVDELRLALRGDAP